MQRRPSLFKACVFLFAATTAALGVAQAADSKLDSVLQRGKLIVGTGSTNAPWHFQGADGKLQGFDIDIARMVAKGLFNDPEKVEFVVQSSDARIPNLLTDKVDMSCQFITVTASRAQQVAFTLPYYREGVGLLLPANSKYKEIEDLKAAGDDVTVAVLQNVYAEELVHQALPKAKVDQYDSVDLMYQAVNSGRADAAATDQSSVKYLMVQNPGRYRSPAYAWSPQTYACAVKRGDQDWLNFVNTTLHEAMTGVEFPTYAASFKQWFGVELPSPAIGFPVEFK
ncbi:MULTISPECIES: transporter substrate-binding domain-containing protein [unclassified Pseudomonas]|uniref:transporter substrate-binding domain-containing protein n=1 Tax=unclassified Pseudomonas TaxID=196821 RepID=UPI0008713163|nr:MULTISPECIES: transporter substrate-binding domain-containing protein [unclassified Pseudomonas]SCW30496.1 amino acid ABC transporter substrate-binding protein, PAAT family [Pseudomonas sp. NFACC05-1]SDX83375.1 amino acid ABC transporter substrate-binding protein, PAAT family [Pseudomonas sp. NFACC08-1]SEI55415.1 amino acid ABC transporter substrate-binding protein, PAAT family [Pseudomonas sp. NFACC07-1]SFL08246.1 amino acid ABC transporter substrate-binding protein, PAAT family [Pseudomona